MDGRPSWDEWALGLAQAVAERADCTRRQVGAVILDPEHRVVSTGYNGAPSGGASCLRGECPRGKLSYAELPADSAYTNCVAIHAESNSLLYARRDLRGCTIYVTAEPCHECRRLIAGAGITRVVTPESVV